MRFSCLTSKFVCVVLETSMYFSGTGNDSSLGEESLTLFFNVMAVYEVSRHGPKVVYCFTGIRKWVLRFWKRPFWFSKKVYITLSLNWSMPYQGGCSQVLISSKGFDSSICGWKIEFSISFWKYYFFCIESFRVDFRCVHRVQLLKVCDQYVTLPNSSRVQSVSEEQSR